MHLKIGKQIFPTKKSPGFTGEFYHTLEKLIPILLSFFQKIEEKRTLSNSFCKASITMIPKSDKDAVRREHYRLKSLNDIDVKILNKISANQIQLYIQRITHHEQVGFIQVRQGWFNTCKSSDVINHSKKVKDKNHMITSIDAEKIFDNIQHFFMIKTFNKLGIKETYLNIISS